MAGGWKFHHLHFDETGNNVGAAYPLAGKLASWTPANKVKISAMYLTAGISSETEIAGAVVALNGRTQISAAGQDKIIFGILSHKNDDEMFSGAKASSPGNAAVVFPPGDELILQAGEPLSLYFVGNQTGTAIGASLAIHYKLAD